MTEYITDPTSPVAASNHTASRKPWTLMRQLIAKIEKVDTLQLAERYLNIPRAEFGIDRTQKEPEIIVLVVEHFAAELDQVGWGAQIMKGTPHVYTGAHWTSLPDADLTTLLGMFSEAMGLSPAITRSHGFRKKLLKQFRSRLRSEPVSPERESVIINLQNGTMELGETLERLRPFAKADHLTYQLPFAFDPAATCPLFQAYLERVLPDAESQMVVAEFFGWMFLRSLKLEKVLLLYGEGSNGKSVLFDVINALLGDENVSNLSLKSLGKLENRFRLGNALLNFGSEINDQCDPAIFKKLASGEPMEARKLFNDVYEMTHYARLAFNTNVLPQGHETTEGYYRRFLIVPFTQFIPDSEKDVDLARTIIATELPGVLNWILEGMRRLRANRKFTHCPASEEALHRYRAEHDTVTAFLEDAGMERDGSAKTPKDALYDDYRSYCKNNGVKSLSKIHFGKGLKRLAIGESKVGSVRYWLVGSSE